MDSKPFWEFNITELTETNVLELKKYQKNIFNVAQILSAATELKYTREIKKLIASEFSNPTDQFVRLFAKQIYSGVVTAKMMEQFTPMVKKSLQQYVSDMINDRLKTALSNEAEAVKMEQEAVRTIVTADEARTEFTEDEKEGFHIIKSILRTKVDSTRLYYRDTTRYLNILLDDTIRKTVCRLYLNGAKKYVGLMEEGGKETKIELTKLDDIYNYSEQLINTVLRFEGAGNLQPV